MATSRLTPPTAMQAAAHGLTHGSLGLAESVGTGLQYVGAVDLGDKVEKYWGEKAKAFEADPSIQGSIVKNPALLKDPSWWAYNLAEMAPSFAAAMVPGVAAGKYIKIAGQTMKYTPALVSYLAKVGTPLVAGISGGALEGSQTYKAARDMGVKAGLSKDEAHTQARVAATEMMAASAALNAYSFGKILTKQVGIGKALKHIVGSAVTEGGTEWAEEPTEAAILEFLKKDPSWKPIWDATVQGANVFPIAALTGGLGAGGSLMAQRGADVAPGAMELENRGPGGPTDPRGPGAQPRPVSGSFEGTVLEFKVKQAMGLKPADHLTPEAVNAAFAAGKIPQDLAEQMGHPGALEAAAAEAAKNAPPAPALDPASQQMSPEQDIESRQEAISQPHPRTGQPVYAMSESDFSAAMREVAPEMSPETISKRYQALLSESKDLKLVDDREIAQINDPKLAAEANIAQAAGDMLPEDHEFNFMEAGPASLSAMPLDELQAKFPGMDEQLHRELVVAGLDAGQITPDQAPYPDIRKAAIERVNQEQLNVEKRQDAAAGTKTPILQMLWKRKLNRAGAAKEGIDLSAMRGYFTEKGGMTIEQATENAYEMGWIPEYDQAMFLEAMDKELMRREGVLRSPEESYSPEPTPGQMFQGGKYKGPRPDWADEFEGNGHKIYPDGTILVYHGTTKEKGAQILKEGLLRRPADAPDSYGVHFSTSKDISENYGDGTVIAMRVPIKGLNFEDVFPNGRMDFMVETKNGIFKPARLASENENPNFLASPGQEYNPTAPAFYSKLTKTIEAKMSGPMPAEQLMGLVKSAGIKQDELDWFDLPRLLKDNPKPTKQQVLDYLAANQLRIEEVSKTEMFPDFGDMRYKSEDNESLDGFMLKSGDGKIWIEKDGKAITGKYNDTGAGSDLIQTEYEQYRKGQSVTKFSQYQLPGGENYREVLFTLPAERGDLAVARSKHQAWADRIDAGETLSGAELSDYEKNLSYLSKYKNPYLKEGATFTGGHWSEPNVLAHMRLNDRTIDGKRTLFIEEVQSDWHQKGRDVGYVEKKGHLPPDWTVHKMSEADVELFGGKVGEWALFDSKDEMVQYVGDSKLSHEEAIVEALKEAGRTGVDMRPMGGKATEGVPDAPLKKTWHEFVMKRAIRMAAEQGYDAVAWTTGEQQAERYDLSKQVDQVQYKRNADGSYDLFVILKGKDTPTNAGTGVTSENLEKYVGKDLAVKIRDNKMKSMNYKGLDLKIGDHGMSVFYDQMLPGFVGKFTKKWGGVVKDATVLVPGYNAKGYENEDFTVHSLTLTPELKQAALAEGFPLFAPGHVYTPGELMADEAGTGANTALAVADTRRVRPVGQWHDLRKDPAVAQINKDFIEKQLTSAIGKKIDTIQDVAEIAAMARHPRIEHLVVVKLKKDKVIGSMVLTDGKIGIVTPDADMIERFLRGADEFYMSHNHPTGNPTPSEADIESVKLMAEKDKRFKGHVVTDHETYTAIMPDGTAIAQEYRGEKQSFRKDIEKMSSSPAIVSWVRGTLQGDTLGIMFVDSQKQVMAFVQVDPRSNYNAYIQRNASKYGAVGVFLVTGDAAAARMTPRVLSGSYYDLLVIGADGQYRSAALGHLPGFSIDLADTQKFPELEGVFGSNRLAETPADYNPEDYQNIIGRFKPGMKLTLRSRFTSAQFPKGLPRGSEFELKAVAKTGEMLVTYQGRVVAMILNPSLFKETYRAPIVRAPVIPEATWLRGMERAGARDTGLPPTETTALVNAELPPGEKVNVWGDIIKYYMGTKRERFQAMAGSVEKGNDWYNAVRQMAVNLSSVKKMVEVRNKGILGSVPEDIRAQVHDIVKGINMSASGEIVGGGIQPAGVVQGKMLQVGQELPDNRIIGNEIEPGVYQLYRFFNTLGDYKTMVAEHPETVKFFKAFLATSEILDKTKLGQELPAFSREVMKSQYDIRTVHPTGYLWVPSVKPEQKFFTKIGNLFKSYIASGRKYKTGILAERGGENKDLLKTLTEKQVEFAYENIYNNTVGDILATILEPIGIDGVKSGFIEVNLNKPKLAAIIELKRGLLLANGIDVAKISEYQYPMDIEKEFNLQRTAKFNPARQAVVDDMKKRTNEFVGYVLTNYLIRPSTAVRNLTSGFVQYNLRTLTHFYEGILGAGFMPAVNDIKALGTSLLPSVRQEIPAEMLGINFFSEIPGNLNLMNKALGPFKAVEVFFKRASFDSDLSTLAGKAYDAALEADVIKRGDKAQFIKDWRVNFFQDVFNFLSDNSDSVTFNYGNKPYFLEKMSNSIGRGMVPFISYPYHKWRMYSEYSPQQLAGMDKSNYKNKISKMMAGITMFTISSIIASGLVEDRRRRLKKLEIKKLPWGFDTTGRIKVYADDEVERWLRIYDLPFIGDSVYMLEILNGLSGVEDWMKDTLSMGPIFNFMAMVAGLKSKYTIGSPASSIAGQQVAGFIPFGAYLQYARIMADPVKRKTYANNYSAFEDFINPIINAVPGASKMLDPQIGKTGAEKGHIRKYDIPGQTMSFFFLNIRSIDKQEYKQYMIDQYMSGKVQKRIEKETLKKVGVPPQ